MEWAVLDWNEPALRFYQSLDARQMNEWIIHRLTPVEIGEAAAAQETGISAEWGRIQVSLCAQGRWQADGGSECPSDYSRNGPSFLKQLASIVNALAAVGKLARRSG